MLRFEGAHKWNFDKNKQNLNIRKDLIYSFSMFFVTTASRVQMG